MTQVKTEAQADSSGSGDDLGSLVCLIGSEQKTIQDRHQLVVFNEFKVQDNANLIVIGEIVIIAES